MESGLAMLAERRAHSSTSVCLGFDLGAPSLEMAVPGVNSIITAAAHQHGHWVRHARASQLWLAPDLLDTIACREAGPGAVAVATVAVPGWFGALDRAATRTTVGGGGHVLSITSTTLAAAIGWQDSSPGRPFVEAMLCLDTDVGLSASVLLLESGRWSEVAVASVPPRAGLEAGSPTRVDVIAGLVGHVVRLAEAAGVARIDTALALASSPGDPLVEQWPRLLAAVTPHDGPPVSAVAVDRRGLVARGAVVAATGRAGACVRSAPHRLGVVVESEQGLEVMTLVPASHPLPATFEREFAADAQSPVRFDLVEARRPGAAGDPADWETVATAIRIGPEPDLAAGRSGLVAVDIQIALDDDGVVSIGPSDRWEVVVGCGAVELLAMPSRPQLQPESVGSERVAPASEPRTAASTPSRAASAAAVGEPVELDPADLLAGRTLSWSAMEPVKQVAAAVWPPPCPEPASPTATRTSPDHVGRLAEPDADSGTGWPAEAAGAAMVAGTTDDIEEHARHEAAAFMRELGEGLRADGAVMSRSPLDDVALEEIARAEVGAPNLAAALAELERRISRHVGIHVGVRSVPALLDCDDDAAVEALRMGAARLEAALVGQPDDELTSSVRAAIRAARRTFADGSSQRFVGGSAIAIAADAVAVVDHLRLVVGEVQAAERRRLLLDARLRGLSSRAADELITGLIGPTTDSVTDVRSAPAPVRDAVARLGVGHRGWSLEVHADPGERPIAETRSGIAQIRLLLLEPCGT